MSVLIDTGVLYAEHDRDAARHESAAAALDAVFDGEFGQPYLSDYVVDEAVTLTRSRAATFGPVGELINKLRGRDPYPSVYELLFVSRDGFADAFAALESYTDHSLSFTDATTVVLCDAHEIDQVLSYDDDFDGLVPRLDPEAI